MGVKVDVLEELRLRIQGAVTSGALTDVKRVLVGYRYDIRKPTDLPIINITLANGVETDIYSRAGAFDRMRIDVTLICPVKDADANTDYNTSDETGAQYYLEALQNAIDNNTSGNLDLTFNNTARLLQSHEYSINYNDNIIEIIDTITIDSIQFTLGAR